ncbi:MAG TPA: lipoprotein [Caldimonas sp.]|jgi:predicted small lipoprotein YifL
MSRRFGSVVATAERMLGAAVLAMLAACGQKGPLVGVKPAAPAIAADVAPDAAVAVPASVAASNPVPRR